MTRLLAPAGNMEKLKVAVAYGADEVYFGLDRFSLRSFAGNFTMKEATAAISYLHDRGRMGYATLNIYPFETEYPELLESAIALEEARVDGLIISDIGVLNALRKAGVRTPLHISTQANTMSPQTAMAFREMGASRVNLARELSLEQIRSLVQAVSDIEIEIFIHGAVCFSYSGRCAISDYLTGRRANRGECTHPCRWSWQLIEEKRPNEVFSAREDSRGVYLFNSKDLALFSYVRPLMEMGLTAFKIEGRMKSIHYIASVLFLYRRIRDGATVTNEEALTELDRIRNRGYSEGFMKGGVLPSDYRFDDNTPQGHSRFLGMVVQSENGLVMDIRNRICADDEVEILTPAGEQICTTLPSTLFDAQGNRGTVFHHGRQLTLPFPLPEYAIVRKLN